MAVIETAGGALLTLLPGSVAWLADGAAPPGAATGSGRSAAVERRYSLAPPSSQPDSLVERARRLWDSTVILGEEALWGALLPNAAAARARRLCARRHRLLFVGDPSLTAAMAATLGADVVTIGVTPRTRALLELAGRHLGVDGTHAFGHRDEGFYDAALVVLPPGRRRYAGLYEALRRVRPGGELWVTGASVDTNEHQALAAIIPNAEHVRADAHALLPCGLALEPAGDAICIARPDHVPSLHTLAARTIDGAGLCWEFELAPLSGDSESLGLLTDVLLASAQAPELVSRAQGADAAERPWTVLANGSGATLSIHIDRADYRAELVARDWNGWIWAVLALAGLHALCGTSATRVRCRTRGRR
jgi:hypothetical protein